MPDATNLYLFIVAALLLLIVPGPNMAIVTSHAVATAASWPRGSTRNNPGRFADDRPG